MLEFMRYSVGIEAPDPNFDSALQTVLDDLRSEVRASPNVEGGHAVRNAHAQGYRLARGEFEILGGLPKEYAQGIYVTPGRHEALVGRSNGIEHLNADRVYSERSAASGRRFLESRGPGFLEDEPAAQPSTT